MKKLRKSVAYCECRQGYTGSGTQCREIDPCQAPGRGGCHDQASCIKTRPGQSRCECDRGYVGDGYFCYPSTHCNSSLECADHARCRYTAPGQFQCVCEEDYHGNGTYCVMNDICQDNNGGCHPQGSCSPSGPGQANCTCPQGLGGDGYTCYGDLVHELENHPSLTKLYELFSLIPYDDNVMTDLDGNYTLLAPNNSILVDFVQSAPVNFFNKEENLLILAGYHLLPAAVTVNELKTVYSGREVYPIADGNHFSLNITTIGENVYINDAMIIESDILALNGYIHIIDKVLEPYPISDVPQTLDQLLLLQPQLSTTLQYLQKYDLLEDIQQMESYTLFVPNNQAWIHYTGDVSRRLLQYLLVPKLVMTWEATTSGVILYSMIGDNPNHQLLLTLINNNQVKLNNKLLEKAMSNMLTLRGVVHTITDIPTVQLNYCDVIVHDSKTGACGACDVSTPCPPGYHPIEPEPVTLEGNCTYTVTRLVRQQVQGCQQLCHNRIQKRECCPGYYGAPCTECPGGVDSPCSNQGNCTDGINGQGRCVCDDGYVGDTCQECITETCLNDPCTTSNGGCSEDALCDVSGGMVVCRCIVGYKGDGVTCLPGCQVNNGDCPVGSVCAYDHDDKVTCTCADGKQTDGRPCGSTNITCTVNNGGCSQHATCKESQGSVVSCECHPGYVGNGTVCNGDLWRTLLTLPQASNYRRMVQMYRNTVVDGLTLVELLQDSSRNITVFVPSNKGLNGQDLPSVELARYISARWIGLLSEVQSGHTTYYAIDGSILDVRGFAKIGEIVYNVNGVPVVEANIPATNGIVHLLASPFTIIPQAITKNGQASHHFPMLFGIILGAIVIILVLAFVVWKTRHQARVLIDRMRVRGRGPFMPNIDVSRFNFLRFSPGASHSINDPLEDNIQGENSKSDDLVTGKPVGIPASSFNNPVFNQCSEGDEDQLIFK